MNQPPAPTTRDLLIAALAKLRAGQLKEAEERFAECLRTDVQCGAAHYGLALVSEQRGDEDAAANHAERAITLLTKQSGNPTLWFSKPGNDKTDASAHEFASAQFRLGRLLRRRGKPAVAVHCLSQALAWAPNWAEGHHTLGHAWKEAGRSDQAIESYRRAIQLQPDLVEAYNNLAIVYRQRKAYAQAEELCEQALARKPDFAAAFNTLGTIQWARGGYEEAAKNLRRAIRLQPARAEFHSNLGLALRDVDRLDDAVDSCRRAIELDSKLATAHYNLGLALTKRGETDEGLASYKKALAIHPTYAEAENAIGNVYKNRGEYATAGQHYARALEINPRFSDARFNQALLLLAQGDYAHGWEEYESRWQTRFCSERSFSQPWWDGSDLSGRTILLHAEQGLGDTLQFIRYARLVKERGATVILECQRPLVRLLAGCREIDQLVEKGQPLPDFDVHAPLLSLPRLVGTRLDNIPTETPYLFANNELTARYASLRESQGGTIAINWRGGPTFRGDWHNSAPLLCFAALGRLPGVRLVSIQKGASNLHKELGVRDLGSDFDESSGAFMDSAAVIRNADLVITCDTSVAHLAGGLGADVWVPLCHVADWRFLIDRSDSPWYPNMKLFRQPQPGDWIAAFEQIASQLYERPELQAFKPPQVALELDHEIRVAEKHLETLLAEHLTDEASEAAREILQVAPDHSVALHAMAELATRADSHAQAATYLRRAVESNNQDPSTLRQLGSAYRSSDRLRQAVEVLEAALQKQPDDPDTLFELALTRHRQRELIEAKRLLTLAFKARPSWPEATRELGRLEREIGNPRAAQICFEDALNIRDDANGRLELGNLMRAQGNLQAALAHLQRAVQLNPEDADAHYYFALAQRAVGNTTAAKTNCEQAVQLRPNFPEALNVLGVLCKASGDIESAIKHLRRAVRLRPSFADAYNNLGNALGAAGHHDEATANYRRAVQFHPRHPEAQNNLGTALRRQRQFKEAESAYERAIDINPKFVVAHYNLGNLRQAELRLDEAFACYERALKINANHVFAHHNRALLWLLRGDFERGWPEYEWRWRTPDCPPREFDRPAWDGSDPSGKTILLYAEQGLGDTIHFVRYARKLKESGARVIVECQKILVPLLTVLREIDTLVARGDPLPAFDCHAALMSLPLLFKTRLETIPSDGQYLPTPRERIEQWRRRLPYEGDFRIGICWQGSTTHANDAERSFPLACLAPLAQLPGVRFVSLQKGAGTEQLADVPFEIVDLGDELDASGAFLDTAAVMKCLNLIVTCDTAVAHLAGAVGAPTWLALSQLPDWRWLLDRDDSPWYPTLRLFRQEKRNDWGGVFSAMADELPKLQETNSKLSVPASAPESSALKAAMLDHHSGHLQKAKTAYEAIVKTEPDNVNALHLAGLASHQLGEFVQAAKLQQQALTLAPEAPQIHNHLGVSMRALGRMDESRQCFERALQIQPTCSAAHFNLGVTLQRQGQGKLAEQEFRQTLETDPRHAKALFQLSLILQGRVEFEEAADCLRKAVAIRPDFAAAHENLGMCLTRLTKYDEAVEAFERALQLKPTSVELQNKLGNARKHQGSLTKAAEAYERALDLDPNFAQAHYNLGVVLADQGKLNDAAEKFRAALKIDGDFVKAHKNLCHMLKVQGKLDEAVDAYERALASHATPAMRFAEASILPVIYQSEDEISQWRRRLIGKLSALSRAGVQIDPLRDSMGTMFFLAYQGKNDRKIQEMIARLCADSAIDTTTQRRKREHKRIRVGFVSNFLREHTIGKLWRGIIANLNRERFEVSVLSMASGQDSITRFLRERADHFISLPKELPAAQQQIAKMELDTLFYTDIGMSADPYALAVSRLAPVQCATWGHPVTTGLPNMDYFLSSKLMETKSSRDHYTEELVQFDSVGIHYYRPKPADPQARASFGFEPDWNVYLVPQSLFKFHPDFDVALGEILRRDQRGHLVVLSGQQPHWNELLQRRFDNSMPDVVERVQFVPRQSEQGFLNLVASADVALDTFHFGGGNTTYEALALGVPVVTLPSNFLRGRITRALYETIGFHDCIAASCEEYVEKAVALGTDRAFRESTSKEILEAAPRSTKTSGRF